MDSRGHGSASNSPSGSHRELRKVGTLSGLGASDTALSLPLAREWMPEGVSGLTQGSRIVFSYEHNPFYGHNPMSPKTENCGNEF